MSTSKVFRRAKPFLAVLFLQFGLAGMDILSKAALNQGMSNYVFVVYRHAIATIVIAPFAIILDKSLSHSLSLINYFKVPTSKLNYVQESKAKDDKGDVRKDYASWPVRVSF